MKMKMRTPEIDIHMTRHPLLVVFLFITICLLPVMIMRDFTPDNELRYLQIADEAIENGNLFAFTLDGEVYADKPPLYLWIVMLCRLLIGKHSMLLLSLFSLLPAFVIINVMDRWAALEKVSDRIAMAFMMMTCALFLGMSVFLRMDMLMTMFIVLALRSFWLLYTGCGNQRKQEVLLPLWIFLALFTKGPVGILMPLLAIGCFLLFRRKGREIGKYLGWKTLGIIAALCAVWFIGAYLDGGKDYLKNLLFHQTFGRAVNSFHHKAPFWYYLVAIWYIVAPYMFLLVGALVVSIGRKRRAMSDAVYVPGDKEVFLAVTIASTFVMLSLFSGKLSIYLAPVMPFMVLLFVEVLRRIGWRKWMTWSHAVPVGLIAVLSLASFMALCLRSKIPALTALMEPYQFLRSWAVLVAVLILLSGSVYSLRFLYKNKPSFSIMFLGASILLAVYSAAFALPQANDWIGYGNLCATISPEEEVATLYIRRPGPMKVYLGREIVDFQRDFVAFESAGFQGVLVTRSKWLERDKALEDFVKGRSHWFVGPYCLTKTNLK